MKTAPFRPSRAWKSSTHPATGTGIFRDMGKAQGLAVNLP